MARARTTKKTHRPTAKSTTGDLTADVVIVGGGLAGLTAAVALHDSGLSTIVVERDGLLGGRARSWIDPKTGDPVHIGPHILLSEYPNMLKLLRILGTQDKVVWQEGDFIVQVQGREEILTSMDNRLPAPFHWAPSLFSDPHFSNADLLSNLPVSFFAMQLTEPDLLELDDENALALLKRMGVSERFIQRFWAFTAMAILNVPLEVCSAGALMRFYRRLIGHRGYHVGFPDGGLGDLFAPAARERIERFGGQVLLDTEVARFSGDAARATGVELVGGRRIRARHSVAALPPAALRRVCRPEWMTHTSPFGDLVHFVASPYVSTFLWFDRKLTERQFWARVHDPNDLNCDFYDLSNIHRGWKERPSVIATNCIYCERARDLDDAEIVQTTVRELAEYLPEAAHAKVTHAVVNRIPMAIHCPFPGTERRRPPVVTPIQSLTLASDWIATGLPSSMESACMAGWRAAEAILASEGQPRSLAIEHRDVEGLVKLVARAGMLRPRRSLARLTAPLVERLRHAA